MSQRNRQSRSDRRGELDRGPSTARGFTLVELLVVMVIISILLGFILNAAMGSVKQAQERATQALITKLEGGPQRPARRPDAEPPRPGPAHKLLAAIYTTSNLSPIIPAPAGQQLTQSIWGIQPWPVSQRAQVIAWYDFIKSEMPDVFFVQNASPTAAGVGSIRSTSRASPTHLASSGLRRISSCRWAIR